MRCPHCLYREDGGVRQFCATHARILGLDEPLQAVIKLFAVIFACATTLLVVFLVRWWP